MSEETEEEAQTYYERYTRALADLYVEKDVYFPGAIYAISGAPVPFDRQTGLPFWCGDRLQFEQDFLRESGADEYVRDFGDVRDFHSTFAHERDLVKDLARAVKSLKSRVDAGKVQG